MKQQNGRMSRGERMDESGEKKDEPGERKDDPGLVRMSREKGRMIRV